MILLVSSVGEYKKGKQIDELKIRFQINFKFANVYIFVGQTKEIINHFLYQCNKMNFGYTSQFYSQICTYKFHFFEPNNKPPRGDIKLFPNSPNFPRPYGLYDNYQYVIVLLLVLTCPLIEPVCPETTNI